MNIEKICKYHGKLEQEDIVLSKNKLTKSGFTYNCRLCRNANAVRYRQKNSGICRTHGILAEENIKSDGRCKICHKESANRKRNLNREWFNAKMAKDREENPEKWKEIHKKQYAAKKAKHGYGLVKKEICRMHGLSIEQYELMFKEQDHRCAICNREESRKSAAGDVMKLCVDHDHESGIVRGLLCHACNTALGKFEDDIDIIHSAIIYLEQHQHRIKFDG